MRTYPIKFEPILKEKIWGGSKLKNILGKATTGENIGESWEISGVEGSVSRISNGLYKGMELKTALEKFQDQFLGTENFEKFGTNFPLLIKFLDAQTNLSVQVHPDDKKAKELHDSFGKTEMWYIMDSDPDAEIVLGLKDVNTNLGILSSINAENVSSIFNTEKVKKGDSYFIPAGKVHAIGAGILAAEIQQTSDITYRVYDWDRKDAHGNERELHTQLAIDATKKFEGNGKKEYTVEKNTTSNLADCDYFTTNVIEVSGIKKLEYERLDSFVVLMCVNGRGSVTINDYTEHISLGETVLVPSISKDVVLRSSNARFLEVFIRPLMHPFQTLAA